jgi:hypothetical protein
LNIEVINTDEMDLSGIGEVDEANYQAMIELVEKELI